MEIGKGPKVWKIEGTVDKHWFGFGIAVGDPEGFREDIGLVFMVGPLQVFVGRGLTWKED